MGQLYEERVRENERAAIGLLRVAKLIGINPKLMIQVGVGVHHPEVGIAKDLWPELELIGFEPHPETYRRIKKTYPGKLRDLAIADEIGLTPFRAKKRHPDGSSLMPFGESVEVDEQSVSVTTLDGWLSAMDMADKLPSTLLWMDCEGSELLAMRGGAKTICAVDAVILEMTGGPPSGEWQSSVDTHYHLIRNGFLRQWIHCYHPGPDRGNDAKKPPATAQYDALYVRKKWWSDQWCCCPVTVLEESGNHP